mmetsp:Transcript_17716/g.38280  ORF Transcript_17716/g.38280 Transcript_17716/m.38280 type:complete len:80 (-) Transcript_17716:122-361(-)
MERMGSVCLIFVQRVYWASNQCGGGLEPIGIDLPWPVPRVHAAKNIGDADYYEILFESKGTSSSDAAIKMAKETIAIEL